MTEDEVKRDVLLAAQPTKRFVAVEEVAGLAVFLASDAAASITGAPAADRRRLDGAMTPERLDAIVIGAGRPRPRSAPGSTRKG